VTFLKSLFAGIVILAVAMLARPLLVSALRISASGAGPSAPPLPATGRAALPTPRAGGWTPPARPASGPKAQKEPEDMLDAVIDVSRIEGRINAASARRLAQLLDRHPDLAAQAVRRWLAQGSDVR
jgi:flagellar M-ring protein FliF